MMVELVLLYLSIVGTLCWWSLILFSWWPWSTREKIEAGVSGNSDTVLIPVRNEGPYIWHTLSGVKAQGEGVRDLGLRHLSVGAGSYGRLSKDYKRLERLYTLAGCLI